MLVSVRSARASGMVTDVADYALPPDVFTLIRNGRQDGASLVRGPIFYDMLVTSPIVDARGIFSTEFYGSTPIFVFYDASAIVHRATDTDTITRGSGGYGGSSAAHLWDIARFNEYVVATNNIDLPQAVALSNAASHPLFVDLPNWPAATLCKLLFSHKNFLVAANVTKTGTNYPRLVKWSHTAAAGVPSSWDETDPTLDTGEQVLSGDGGDITAAASFEDFHALYTRDEVWAMRFIGGQFIFSFNRMLSGVGALNSKSVISLTRSQHVVVTPNFDIKVVSGNVAESVLDSRIAKTILANIGTQSSITSKLVHNKIDGEVWFFFSDNVLNDAASTLAAVWDYRNNTWSLHDVPYVNAACLGPLSYNMTGSFSSIQYVPIFNTGDSTAKIATISPRNGTVVVDSVRSSLVFRIERTGLAVKGVSEDGKPTVDYDTVAMFQEFRPKFRGSGVISISFGVRSRASEAVSFGSPQTWVVGTSEFLPIYLTGRLLDIRMDYSSLAIDMKFEGYDLDVVPLSRM